VLGFELEEEIFFTAKSRPFLGSSGLTSNRYQVVNRLESDAENSATPNNG